MMNHPPRCWALVASLLVCVSPALADNAASPAGDPVLERPTLRSLGAYWTIQGDDNQNATVRLEYRKADGAGAEWKQGAPLFRVDRDAMKGPLEVPEGSRLFAGSAFLLEPNTSYELKLTLADADGGSATKTL